MFTRSRGRGGVPLPIPVWNYPPSLPFPACSPGIPSLCSDPQRLTSCHHDTLCGRGAVRVRHRRPHQRPEEQTQVAAAAVAHPPPSSPDPELQRRALPQSWAGELEACGLLPEPSCSRPPLCGCEYSLGPPQPPACLRVPPPPLTAHSGRGSAVSRAVVHAALQTDERVAEV